MNRLLEEDVRDSLVSEVRSLVMKKTSIPQDFEVALVTAVQRGIAKRSLNSFADSVGRLASERAL